ncbi:hypothetical protein [Acinetobacter sp. YH12072]|uniref:hypothetical protein n=1 Tax=Acinetobacter sp. YH12072 TaxID=2601068 RepID=UPI0015D2AC6F|nr:hypothetical protein [Acinetobacter sp. YH12072]
MVASTDIKFYVHTNNNAPQLQNAYGSMINVLDACLVNGINIGAVSSLTASDTTVTALFSSAHNLMQYQVIKITGVNQPEFNGEHRILTVPNAQSVTFELAEAPSTTIATGTISASLPPLGWEKPFSSTNEAGGCKAAYRSTNLLLPSRPFLRVVDELDPAWTATYAKYAKVGIVEDMTDINTMLGVQSPFDGINPDKNWVGTGSGATAINGWAKWYYGRNISATSQGSDTSSTYEGGRSYVVAGNSDYFYIYVVPYPSPYATESTAGTLYGFGSFESNLNPDTANTFLISTLNHVTAQTNYFIGATTSGSHATTTAKICLQRGRSLIASPAYASTGLPIYSTWQSGRLDLLQAAATSGKIDLFLVPILESLTVRGILPNFYWLAQKTPFVNRGTTHDADGVYMGLNVGSSDSIENQIALKIGDL